MLSATIKKHQLKFAFPAGTSRGVLHEKPTWFIALTHSEMPGITGVGECSPIWGLSPEKEHEYETLLANVVTNINNFKQLLEYELLPYPSIYFGVEMALLDLFKGGRKIFFENDFSESKAGIAINGLVWMDSVDKMYTQAINKYKSGFTCIKLKVGTHQPDEEIKLLTELRNALGSTCILRIDANGAFDYTTAQDYLQQIKTLNIHSIEQPLKKGNVHETTKLCAKNYVPIALDEELIGYTTEKEKTELIENIKPQYVVLKPSLHGGFLGCRQWISAIEKSGGQWWMTSALESNIGLNAIAQFTAQTKNTLHQGLGTGQIYTNNIPSPLCVEQGKLFYKAQQAWQL